MQIRTPEDLLGHQLLDLYDAEHRDLARQPGAHEVADLLPQTLDEETSSDAELGPVARNVVNVGAA